MNNTNQGESGNPPYHTARKFTWISLSLFLILFSLVACGGDDVTIIEIEVPGYWDDIDDWDDVCSNLGTPVPVPEIEGHYPEELITEDPDYWKCDPVDGYFDSAFNVMLARDGTVAVTGQIAEESIYGICNPEEVGDLKTFDGVWFVVNDAYARYLNVLVSEISPGAPIDLEILELSEERFRGVDWEGRQVSCER